ncbi:MAG: FAD-binding oxidoreductase [Roseiflexaceae bacterium]
MLEQIAETLRNASERGQPVVPWGCGTRQHIGAAPPAGALRLDTTMLDRVLDYVPSDLTITVEAGVTLAAIQALLKPHQQWLPWDPPCADATVGGLLASAASGPLRLGYGTPRDWVLGMRVALGDGRLVKSGGKVVKNVAGYDSHKLHIGALCTLGLIGEVTFKIAPLPECSGTLVFPVEDTAAALHVLEALRNQSGQPVSLTLFDPPPDSSLPDAPLLLAVRYAGIDAAVGRQLAAGAALAPAEQLAGAAEQALWAMLAGFSNPAGGLLLRAGVRPAALAELLALLRRHSPDDARLLAHSTGLAYARWPHPTPEQATRDLAALRTALAPLGGYAVVEDAPATLRPALDLWGPPPETLPLMRALKRQWDPQNILNPGRYLL